MFTNVFFVCVLCLYKDAFKYQLKPREKDGNFLRQVR